MNEDIKKESFESYLADNNLEYKIFSKASERQEFESVPNTKAGNKNENPETDVKKKEFKMTSEIQEVVTHKIAEYLEILMLISSQNNIIDLIQKKLIDKCKNQSNTKCEETEIRDLRRCLDKEKSKLKCVLKKKFELQKKLLNQSRQDDKITILEKDSINFKLDDKNSKIQLCPENDEDFKSFICCLMNQADININNECDEALFGSILSLLEEKGFRPKHGVASTFNGKIFENKRKNRKYINDLKLSEKSWQCLCEQLMNQINISQERLANDNSNLEYDRMKLQEELVLRDNKISDLEKKFNFLQEELCNLVKENEFHGGSSRHFVNNSVETLQNIRDNNVNLKLGIDDMQHIVERLKTETEDLKKERERTLRKSCKSDELEKLETTYRLLLSDYTVADNELKNIKEKFKRNNGSNKKVKSHKRNDKFRTEIKVLKEKITDMMKKQENFKSSFIEQAEQLKEYQSKYQFANQTAEEQKSILEKLEEQNKRIENQINLEIQNLKEKFSEKIQELAEIPKFIENEKAKITSVSEEKKELEQKLPIICNEYQELRRKYKPIPKKEIDGLHSEERYKKVTVELQSLKTVYDNLKKEQDDVNEKLQTILNETDVMRTEVAREIALIKEKAEYTKKSIVEYIRRIEKEMVDCQINATTSIEEREEIITKMRKQLTILSRSFDTIQREIRNLRIHVHKLSSNA